MRFLFSRKALILSLWVIPTLALLTFAVQKLTAQPDHRLELEKPAVKVPIQILKDGEAPQTIYVELSTPAIPEPSTLLLLPLSAALMFRRIR